MDKYSTEENMSVNPIDIRFNRGTNLNKDIIFINNDLDIL